MLATVALNLTETIPFYSNTDVRTRPVQKVFCLGCVFCFLKKNVIAIERFELC